MFTSRNGRVAFDHGAQVGRPVAGAEQTGAARVGVNQPTRSADSFNPSPQPVSAKSPCQKASRTGSITGDQSTATVSRQHDQARR